MRKHPIKNRIFMPLTAIILLFTAGVSSAADVSLMVKEKTERRENHKEDIRESANGNEISTFTETETEVCTLTVTVKARVPLTSCRLEWCFLSEKTKSARDKGTLVIFSPGKKELSLKDASSIEEIIVSAPFIVTTISSSNSNAEDKISGDEYKGYIVLVTQGGEIIAKTSNSSRFLKDEWIDKFK